MHHCLGWCHALKIISADLITIIQNILPGDQFFWILLHEVGLYLLGFHRSIRQFLCLVECLGVSLTMLVEGNGIEGNLMIMRMLFVDC